MSKPSSKHRAVSTLGDFFYQRQEPGRAGLPVMSITMNDNLVFRDDLERRTESALAPQQHLLVRKGDITYNTMRMWQGACGLAAADGIVSPAYVVLAPKDRIDPRFAYQWFKTDRMKHLFWAYSHGLTEDRLRLYFDELAKIPATPPNIVRQKQIVSILDTWDGAIDTAERLVETRRRLAKGILDHVVSSLCREPSLAADHIRLGEIAKFRNGLNFNGASRGELVKVLGVGEFVDRTRISQFSDVPEVTVQTKLGDDDLLQDGDLIFVRSNGSRDLIGRCLLALPGTQRISFSGFTIRARIHDHRVDSRYVLAIVQSQLFKRALHEQGAGSYITNLNQELLSEFEFPLPGWEEQHRIVAAIEAADHAVNVSEALLSKLRIQKRSLTQTFLNDGDCGTQMPVTSRLTIGAAGAR